jgi:hypothetical protein
MTSMSPTAPTRELIENGTICEDRFYEFKRKDVIEGPDAEKKRSDIVDDVIGFLNAERPGHIVFGVKDKGGNFDGWTGFLGDRDVIQRRVISFLQDLIDPTPTDINCKCIDLDNGEYAIDLRIPLHRLQPYQNKKTGGFKLRTDRKNVPNEIIRRDKIFAHFKKYEEYEAELKKLCLAEDQRIADANEMADEGAILKIGILPRDHYEGAPPINLKEGLATHSAGTAYHGYGDLWLHGCENGQEAVSKDGNDKVITRLMIADDWFIHATIAHPIPFRNQQHVLPDMKADLLKFLSGIQLLAEKANIRGPFLHRAELTQLGRGKIAKFFNKHGPLILTGTLVERIDDDGFVTRLYQKTNSVSIHG